MAVSNIKALIPGELQKCGSWCWILKITELGEAI